MTRNNFWRAMIVVGVVLWSFYEIYPPKSRDLVEHFRSRAMPSRVDATFSNIVETARALQKESPERAYGNLQKAIGTNDVTKYFPFQTATNELYPNNYVLNRLQREAAGRIKLGIDLQGGTAFTLEMQTNALATVSTITNAAGLTENVTNLNEAELEGALSQAVEVLRKRVDRFGVAEPVIRPLGKTQIEVQLPGLSENDKEQAKIQIQRAAFLEFRLVHEKSEELLAAGEIPAGYQLLKRKFRDKSAGTEKLEQVIAKRRPERGLTGAIIKRAGVTSGNLGEPVISFVLNDQGTELFGEVTRANIGRRLAIVLDGELYSAPSINSAIETGSGIIEGNFDIREAFELANVLQNPLKAPLKIIEERSVDPSLGKDSISSGIKASIIAAAGTFLFMLVFYFGSGLVANFALALNILFLMGAMCAFGSALTMPGIAGIALTIGMAVDANVLIYERMREEIAAGKSIRGIINASYQKAFGTIFDSNLTTLIAAVILIKLGTGPVQGFGVTLTIGILVSIFTAFFVTRLIYDFLLQKGWLTKVRMLPLAKFPQFQFMKWGKLTCTASIILILVGVGFGVMQGKKVLGVDFTGGEALTLAFSQRIGEDQLRTTLDKAALTDASIGYQKNLSTGLETLQVVVPIGAGEKAVTVLKETFPQAGLAVKGRDAVGATVGAEIQRSALIASALAMFMILVYVAFRYEFSFAVAAVVALLHDVLITLAIYFLSGKQMTAPMVAAVLTIIGYSINDKIVIMDRIREDLKLGVRGSFQQLIDIALNQTLSRTIITGGAVILATLSLLFFGGSVINDFAFFFLVGIISGTYSSLMIASPIVLWWHKGQRPSIGSNVVVVENGGAVPGQAKV